MQSSGLTAGIKLFYPGVHGAVEPHRSISNSVVKRSSGEDSWGVAPCQNSSMPGTTLLIQGSAMPTQFCSISTTGLRKLIAVLPVSNQPTS